MAGETLTEVTVHARGVLGDRAYALVDSITGKVVSAKHPAKWPDILAFRADFVAPVRSGAPLPPVRISPPHGPPLTSLDGESLNHLMTQQLGREVHLTSAAPPDTTFEYHWPDLDGLTFGGRTYRDEVTEHPTASGTFFDSTPLHLLTTATLAKFRLLHPGGNFDVTRFRPNIVIDSSPPLAEFIENEWVGGVLRIGQRVRIRITKPCLRCVMTTLAQGGLDRDLGILRTTVQHNGGNAGIKGDVLQGGAVRVGDPVRLERSRDPQ